MRSKIALFLAALLFFNIILPSKAFASSVQDQSKPIFGLTADQVVEKYNQLSDQQKDQVLRSLGNTSIFANSLFGNIFNSTFGALDDAITKIGELFFQANGVVYKLGSSALSWVSRLIDKVFNNDVNDLNISQPVIDDLYLYTRGLVYLAQPFFVQGNLPSFVNSNSWRYVFPLPTSYAAVYAGSPSDDFYMRFYTTVLLYDHSFETYVQNSITYYKYYGIFANLDTHNIFLGSVTFHYDNYGYLIFDNTTKGIVRSAYINFNSDGSLYGSGWYVSDSITVSNIRLNANFSDDAYLPILENWLNTYFVYIKSYFVIANGSFYEVPISSDPVPYDITNDTYYNYIYNIPDQTPLNINNIVSNTAINYDPVENIIQYLPDNYNIEQNFSVVNNYYISSGSAITGQAIDVNIVSPGVIDVRVINPEDLTQQVTNNVSKDIINNTDVNFGDLDFSPSVTVGLNAAKDSIEGIVPVTGSSIVAQFVSGIPPDWLALGFVFLILFIVSGFGMSIIRH